MKMNFGICSPTFAPLLVKADAHLTRNQSTLVTINYAKQSRFSLSVYLCWLALVKKTLRNAQYFFSAPGSVVEFFVKRPSTRPTTPLNLSQTYIFVHAWFWLYCFLGVAWYPCFFKNHAACIHSDCFLQFGAPSFRRVLVWYKESKLYMIWIVLQLWVNLWKHWNFWSMSSKWMVYVYPIWGMHGCPLPLLEQSFKGAFLKLTAFDIE